VIAKAVAATAVSTALAASNLTATSAAVKEVPPPSVKSASLLAAEHEARLAAKAVEASQLRAKAMHEAWLKQQTIERQSLPSADRPAPSGFCESPLVYLVARCFGCQ